MQENFNTIDALENALQPDSKASFYFLTWIKSNWIYWREKQCHIVELVFMGDNY